jgi:hypothetical protein
MTKIERLKLRFASGMSEGRISSDEWELEFLPMLDRAEKHSELLLAVANKYPNESRHETALRYLQERECPKDSPAQQEIDSARTPTKE